MRQLVLVAFLLTARGAAAQMDHAAHMAAEKGAASAPAGQSAFAAIADVVRALEADPKTDWSRVDIAALRQHLVDMDEVVLHSTAAERPVDGGVVADVTGDTPRAAAAVGRMVRAHAAALDAEPGYAASAEALPNGGVRLTVRAEDPGDRALVARIRGLGFYGLLTEGNHHAAHHLMIARGEHPHS